MSKKDVLKVRKPAYAKVSKGSTLYVYVGTCGTGRQWFRAWIAVDAMDRQDGRDDGTSLTPGKAVCVLSDWLDKAAWSELLVKPRIPFQVRASNIDSDIKEISVTHILNAPGGSQFEAKFSDDNDPRVNRPRGRGETPTEALREMADFVDWSAALYGWN